MNAKILFISLLILSLSPLAAYASCPEGNPRSLAYIRRDNNRCEGLQERNATRTFSLISFSTSNLSSYPDTLSIRVPGKGNTRPTIEVQSFYRNYRLDSLDTSSSSSGFTFNLKMDVLKRAAVPVRSLRATAYIIRDSGAVYFPVILGKASGRYEFVVYSPRRTTFPTLEIRHNGKVVFSNPRNNPQSSQIRFAWEYGNAPAGSYELHIVDGEGQRRTFRFEHNPKWF